MDNDEFSAIKAAGRSDQQLVDISRNARRLSPREIEREGV